MVLLSTFEQRSRLIPYTSIPQYVFTIFHTSPTRFVGKNWTKTV